MEDLSYLNTEYARSKSIESYNNETKTKEEKQMKRQFFIAGVQFRPKDEIAAALKDLAVGDTLTLVPEPDNRFDPNAVRLVHALKTDKEEICFLGYVPKKFSSEVSALLGIGTPVICTVDEVNSAAKTYEMFKVTVSIPVEDDNGTFEDHKEEYKR